MSAARIRIGFVIDRLDYGGAEGQLCELLRGLDQTRFQCFVYCLSEGVFPYSDRISATGAALRIFKHHGHFDLARLFKLAAYLRHDRIDIVHAFLYLANGYTWAARRLAGVPYLVTSARNCKEVGWLRGWVNRLAFQGSDAILCNGEAVRAFAVQCYHAPATKSIVISNGVDLARFAPASATLDGLAGCRSSTERQVLTIGRLVAQKDLELFLEAAALLAHTMPEVRFVIVGNGPRRRALESQATRLGLDGCVAFLGERGDIPTLLGTTDVFWLTSAWEGLPNVLLEAMACAKPVVARDVGACRELVTHGINGYLVSGRDASKFAAYTLELLSDPARAREMGQAGRRLVEERFSASVMIQATEKLYDSLVGSQVLTTH